MSYYGFPHGSWGVSIAALMAAAGAAAVGGAALISGEADAMGIDFTYDTDITKQMQVITASVAVDSSPEATLTYTSPSVKITRRASGLWTATNGTTELPYEWNSSAVAQGILIEEQRTNLCLRASDLTNAAWTKSNMTTAFTSTGPSGVVNTATRCTASAGNATALQAITSASATRITSMLVKRITGTGNIDITQNNGTNWTTVTTTAGWTRVELTAASATDPMVGIRIVTNADAVDVALFQHEVGAFSSSPILTAGATVTRAVDNIRVAVASINYAASGSNTWFGETGQVNVVADARVIGHDTGRTPIAIVDATHSQWYDGGDFPSVAGATWTSTNKCALAYDEGTANASMVNNGGTVATTANADFGSPTNAYFGQNSNQANSLNGYLRKVALFKRRLTSGQIQTLTS